MDPEELQRAKIWMDLFNTGPSYSERDIVPSPFSRGTEDRGAVPDPRPMLPEIKRGANQHGYDKMSAIENQMEMTNRLGINDIEDVLRGREPDRVPARRDEVNPNYEDSFHYSPDYIPDFMQKKEEAKILPYIDSLKNLGTIEQLGDVYEKVWGEGGKKKIAELMATFNGDEKVVRKLLADAIINRLLGYPAQKMVHNEKL